MSRRSAAKVVEDNVGGTDEKVIEDVAQAGTDTRDKSPEVAEVAKDQADAEKKPAKSIVPPKYAGKYTNGGSDDLAKFINGECVVEGKFDFGKFFALCRKNGVADEHVKPYEVAIAAKAHGAEGRSRMTLRNRLATFARKNAGLKPIDGDDLVPILLPKPTLSGAAAEAKKAEEVKEPAAA